MYPYNAKANDIDTGLMPTVDTVEYTYNVSAAWDSGAFTFIKPALMNIYEFSGSGTSTSPYTTTSKIDTNQNYEEQELTTNHVAIAFSKFKMTNKPALTNVGDDVTASKRIGLPVVMLAANVVSYDMSEPGYSDIWYYLTVQGQALGGITNAKVHVNGTIYWQIYSEALYGNPDRQYLQKNDTKGDWTTGDWATTEKTFSADLYDPGRMDICLYIGNYKGGMTYSNRKFTIKAWTIVSGVTCIVTSLTFQIYKYADNYTNVLIYLTSNNIPCYAGTYFCLPIEASATPNPSFHKLPMYGIVD